MDISKRVAKASVASFFTSMVDRVLGAEVAPVQDRTLNLAHKQANIRAVSVRQGFQAILARGDEMAQRIESYKKQRDRKGDPASTSIDPPDQTETIVMSSTDSPAQRRANMAGA